MTIAERIDWLMKLRKKGGWTGFWSIRRESAEWGYELALADVQQMFLDDLTDEEKEFPAIKRLYKKIATINNDD